MTHEIGHIECGGAGPLIGPKTIEIHDHEIMNVAVHLKHEDLIAFLVATKGWNAEKAEKVTLRFGGRVENDIQGWYERLEELGVEYHEYEPNPANL